MRLDGKTIIITGATTGIGKATAKLFAKKGATVFNLDINKPDYALESVNFIKCDVSNFTSVKKAFAEISSKADSIDYLFANAGIHVFANLEDTSVEEIDKVIGINLKGILYTLKLTLPIMREQKHGSIVLMGSDQSLVGKEQSAIYGTTKGAIAQLSKSTALDYAKYSVRCNCVCPGTIETPLMHNAVRFFSEKTGTSKEDIYASLKTAQPIQRLGKPEEIAEAVLFFCSDKSAFTTGASLSIDGGYTAK
jgi:NAD(P)-dependent dehydrogenase (short-subunit alcohol dehydrogenase family)